MMARTMLNPFGWASNAIGKNQIHSIMVVRFKPAGRQIATKAFTLVEVLISLVILVGVMAGMIYGYVQANQIAEWSSMSLAAQSIASQGAEQARCAKWDTNVWPPTNTGPGTGDELGLTNYTQSGTNYTFDIPVSGGAETNACVTNFVIITKVSDTPPVRQIVSRCEWVFPRTGAKFTNIVITLRAPDQ